MQQTTRCFLAALAAVLLFAVPPVLADDTKAKETVPAAGAKAETVPAADAKAGTVSAADAKAGTVSAADAKAEKNLQERLVQQVKAYLDSNKWKYEYDKEHSVFKMNFSLQSKLKETGVYVLCKKNGINFLFDINVKPDEKSAHETMEFLTRANYGLINGTFEMDLNDNDIQYRVFLPCDNVPSPELIDAQMDVGLAMLQRYGDELLAVIFGMKKAAEAVAAAEAD